MGTGHAPSVFVSSTCYDLAQVRHDLRIFLESMGMIPVLSEFNSFPVNPNLDAIGNCLSCVRERADIFVLVVGGRYGSQTGNGKSVTNLEYLEAKSKGIPRYVFVQKQILSTLPIWQKNKTADFSSIVDDPNLFEFVESLHDPKENWIFPFDSAQEIADTLKNQFAFLFADALSLRCKVLKTVFFKNLDDLSGSALMLVIQKQFAWEHRLFSQVLSDEISESFAIKKDLKYGLILGQQTVPLHDISQMKKWVNTKCDNLLFLIEALKRIVNVALPIAVGGLGEPGNADEIVYIARRFGQVYRQILEWTGEFQRIQADSDYLRVLDILSRASRNIIFELEDFSIRLQQQLSEVCKKHESSNEPQSLQITLNLTCPDMSDLSDALQHLKERAGLS
jgi:hypothetical protein